MPFLNTSFESLAPILRGLSSVCRCRDLESVNLGCKHDKPIDLCKVPSELSLFSNEGKNGQISQELCNTVE